MKVTLAPYTQRHFTCKAAISLTPAQTSDLHELGHCESKSMKKKATTPFDIHDSTSPVHRSYSWYMQPIDMNLRTRAHTHTHTHTHTHSFYALKTCDFLSVHNNESKCSNMRILLLNTVSEFNVTNSNDRTLKLDNIMEHTLQTEFPSITTTIISYNVH